MKVQSSCEVSTVLLIEVRPQSVKYRRYLELMCGRTLLENCLDAISEALRDKPFTVLVFDAQEAEQVARLTSAYRCNVRLSMNATDLPALCDEMVYTGAGHVVAVGLEYVLAPRDLLERATKHHLENDNDFSVIDGLPQAVTPVAFKRSFAESLCQIELPGLAVDSWSCTKLLRGLAASGGIPGLPLHFRPLDALQLYQCENAALPRFVSLESPEAIAAAGDALRRVNAADESERTPFSVLTTWLSETTNIRQAKKRQFLHERSATIDRRCRDRARILFVSNGAGFSGAEQSLCQLLGEVPDSDFEKVALVSLEGEFTRRLREMDVTVVCPNREFAESTLDNVLYVFETCRRVQPSLIHLNGLDGFPIIVGAHLQNVPLVAHVRNGVTSEYMEYVRAAERVIVVSQFLKRSVLQLGISDERVEIIYDEVDPVTFSKSVYAGEQSREMLGIPSKCKVVAMIARLVPYKRHDLMLRAMALLKNRIPNLRLLFVGEGFERSAYSQRILSLISELGLNDAIIRVPFIQDIRRVHSAADVLVLCSEGEGLGRCIVEAMAMEVPVVVTNSGGSHEVVTHEKSGLIVESNNYSALAAAIDRLLTDNALYQACATGARKFVVEHLTAEQSARSVMRLYDHLLGKEYPRTQRAPTSDVRLSPPIIASLSSIASTNCPDFLAAPKTTNHS